APGAPRGLAALAVPPSVRRSQRAALTNKPSNNSLADRLIATVGGERFGGAPTMSKGVQAMSDWLARVGVSPGSYRLANGSGLSHAVHISAPRLVLGVLVGAGGAGAAGGDSRSGTCGGGRARRDAEVPLRVAAVGRSRQGEDRDAERGGDALGFRGRRGRGAVLLVLDERFPPPAQGRHSRGASGRGGRDVSLPGRARRQGRAARGGARARARARARPRPAG